MFDWQTEDDINWDEPEVQEEVVDVKPSRHWIWAILGLVVLLGATAVIVWQRVQQRVAESTLQVEEAVLASVRVIEQAAKDQDSDLFVTFLSGRDANWATAQETAVENNQYLNRSLFGLETVTEEELSPEVEFNLDLTSAIVRIPRSYLLDVGNGIQETVVFSQTAVYRPGPNRWLLAPPDPDFWGEPALYSGALLNVEYPDTPYDAFELSRDLDQFVSQLCTQLADFRSCEGFSPFQLNMTHPAPTLSNLQVLRIPGFGDYRTLMLGIPSPVVVGLPTNELSYRALYNGYANLLGIIVIDELFDSNCCLNNPYYQATRLEMMAQMGVRPSFPATLAQPIPADTPLYTFGDLAPFWNNNYPIEPSEWFTTNEPVSLFIHFLVNELDITTPANLFADIIGGRFSTFPQFVDIVTQDSDMDVASVERAWIGYQFSLTAVAQEEPPIPLPKKELQLLCTDPQNNFYLYRYNLQKDEITFDGTLGFVEPRIMALPNGEGVVIGMRTSNPTEARLLFWVNGRQISLSWVRTQEVPGALPLGFDPTGTYLILGGEWAIYGLMDYQACLNDGLCNFETTKGFPIWSPDQQQTLLLAEDLSDGLIFFEQAHPLILGEASGLVRDEQESTESPLSWEGWSSFWLSSTEVGYLAQDDARVHEIIYRANIDGSEPEPILSMEEIVDILTVRLPITGSRLNWAQSHPLKEETLLMTTAVFSGNDAPAFLIEYDISQESGRILDIFQGQSTLDLKVYDFSPNGRFGAIYEQDENNQNQLLLFDFEEDRVQHTIPNVRFEPLLLSWSDDSEWLLVPQGNALRLVALQHDYFKLLSFTEAGCQSGVWIKPLIEN